MANERNCDLHIGQELAAQESLRRVMSDIFNGQSPEQQREVLRQLADRWEAEEHDSPADEAFRYYREMLAALGEDSFRWESLIWVKNEKEIQEERKLRLARYRRMRELFEIEIRGARRLQRETMALTGNWQEMQTYLRETAMIIKARWMLWLAPVLFRFRVPGAKDVCDAAAFQMFRSVYFPQRG